MGRLCWGLSAVLAVLCGGLIYMFVLRGTIEEADDGRTAILLSRGERNLVLSEMRAFLDSVQGITEAVVNGDMKMAAESATRVGRVDLDDLPASLLRKLPLEVKRLGLSTHLAFHDLAAEIGNGLGGDRVMARMAEILNNCVTCHAGYRIDLENGS